MKPYQMGIQYCAPPAANVTPVKGIYPGQRPWCAKKGMCLSIDPPCTTCALQRLGASQQNTSNQRDNERTAFRIVIAVMCVISFATACGVAGYFSA